MPASKNNSSHTQSAKGPKEHKGHNKGLDAKTRVNSAGFDAKSYELPQVDGSVSFAIKLHVDREKSLLRRHPWIFSKAVAKTLELKEPLRLGSDLLKSLKDEPLSAELYRETSDKSELGSGTLCLVLDSNDKFLCLGHYSPRSQIRVRAISFDPADIIDRNFIKERLKSAISKRAINGLRGDHGIRLVAAEGDYLPGLIVDRFNNVISFAITSWGMEAHYYDLIESLHELFPQCYLYERSDSKSRLKEELPLRAGLIDFAHIDHRANLKDRNGGALSSSYEVAETTKCYSDEELTKLIANQDATGAATDASASQSASAAPAPTESNAKALHHAKFYEGKPLPELQERISLNDAIPDTLYVQERNLVKIPIDVKRGHKTGGYLDQRQSRYRVYELCRDLKALSDNGKKGPSVLNCFSYTGGFGLLALKGGASSVYNIDVSELALNEAKLGVVNNHLDPGRCKFIKKDVFTYLREEVANGTKFDIVILDPPKFIESKSNLVSGSRGYQDINRLGMQLVRKGGRLLTFSCSGLMDEALFQKIVADAALDAKVDAQLVSVLRQDIDHVISLPCPESFYLKGLELIIS